MLESDVINENCAIPQPSTLEPGAGSMLPPATSFATVNAALAGLAQFTANDLLGLPTGLVINATGSSFNSGVLVVSFTLNGKTGTAYAWARSKGMTADGPAYASQFGSNGHAVLIIPGSGNDQAATIISGNGQDYEPILYNPVCTVADGFIQVVPGQDIAMMVGANGLGYLPGAIDNFLICNGTTLATVTMIQAAAIHKWLQVAHSLNPAWPSYSKTSICGLSRGAIQAMIVALKCQPQCAVVASGFSLKDYDYEGLGALGGNTVIGLQQALPMTALIAAIKAAPFQWLFSVSPNGGELALMKWEAQTGYTAGLLANPNVTSTVNPSGLGHAYPPGLGAFLQTYLA